MKFPALDNLRTHEIAKAEIEAWRGRCLNTFSRAERSVTETLETIFSNGTKALLEPLAGQRLNTLEKLAGKYQATDAQKAALVSALSGWRSLDVRRPFFSHGIATELIDRNGQWHVQFDFIAVQKSMPQAQRLNWSQDEAARFEDNLHRAFSTLSSQLGQFRKRINLQNGT